MRKCLVAALALLFLLIAPAMAATVQVSKITADLNYSHDYGGITAGSSKTITLYLPCALKSLNQSASEISVTADSATASTTINLTVNGVAVATNYVITGGSTATWNFSQIAAAGVDMNATKLVVTIQAIANATTSDVITLVGNDVPVIANYTVNITEVELSHPFISLSSWYAVQDIVNVEQTSSLNLTDFKVYLTYPSYAINQPVTVENLGTMNVSEKKTFEVNYQKKGPYVADIKDYVENGEHVTEIKIYSYENLTNVTYEFDPFSTYYKQYFPAFSYDAIKEITFNGEKVTWEKGSILIKDLTVKEGWNTLNVTYYPMGAMMAQPTAVVQQVQPTPFYEQATFWLALLVIVLGALVVVLIAKR